VALFRDGDIDGNIDAVIARNTVATWAQQTDPGFRFWSSCPRSSRTSAGSPVSRPR
jgi:hypothetical protein